MDLFASPQSIGMVAFIAAGCMVAGGMLARVKDTWRVRVRRAVERPPEMSSLPGIAPSEGPRVMVVGVLKVEGLCCSRFEDAAPVAATTFQQRKDPTTLITWSTRAKNLWVDVGGDRVTIDGPVRVSVGSEEQYPATPVEEAGGRTLKRIFASQRVPTQDKDRAPRHGVFRSVKPDDQVVVVGRIEREPDGEQRWTLRADASGAVSIYYRRRPTVRGAFFKLQGWAAAIALG